MKIFFYYGKLIFPMINANLKNVLKYTIAFIKAP